MLQSRSQVKFRLNVLSSQIAQGSLLRGIALGPAGLVRFHDTCSLLTWLLHGSLTKGELCQVSAEFWVGCVPDAMAGGHPIPSSRTPSQPGWPLPGEHALHECSVTLLLSGMLGEGDVAAFLDRQVLEIGDVLPALYFADPRERASSRAVK